MVEFQNSKRINNFRVYDLYMEKYGDRFIEYRSEWNKAGPDYLPSMPLHVDIEVVDDCCLRCAGCFRNPKYKHFEGQMNTGQVFDLGLYEKVVKELSGHAYAINFGYSGECTLFPDNFLHMVEMANDHGFIDKRTNCNGILLNEDLVDRILASSLDYFSISMDAATPETYKKLKGVDKFFHVKRMAEYFMEKRGESKFPLLRLSFYVCDTNKHEAKAFKDKFRHRCDFIDMQGFYGYQDLNTHAVGDKECVYPFKRISIRASGEVFPCCSMVGPELAMGNIEWDTIEDIWRCGRINDLRLQLAHRYHCTACARCLSSIQSDLLEDTR